MANPTISDRLALAACPRQRPEATPCPAPCVDCLAIARAVAHEIADWLRERHGESSTTADLLDGVGCHQPNPPAGWQAIDPGREAAAIAIARELRGPYV
jgi:hypothetical protein